MGYSDSVKRMIRTANKSCDSSCTFGDWGSAWKKTKYKEGPNLIQKTETWMRRRKCQICGSMDHDTDYRHFYRRKDEETFKPSSEKDKERPFS